MTIQQHASFDSSAAELNATSKLVKAWESKNAKNLTATEGLLTRDSWEAFSVL